MDSPGNQPISPLMLPPNDRAAEMAVLGSMVRDNLIIDEVVPILRADEYYQDAHQRIHRAILELQNDRTPIDLVTLFNRLKQNGDLEDIGGAKYLSELWEAAPTAANAAYYAGIVHDKYLSRALIHFGTEVVRDAYQQACPGSELVEDAERKILSINEGAVAGGIGTMADAVDMLTTDIDRRFLPDHPHELRGIPSGMLQLDGMTEGFHPSELTVIAARPSVGKTSFTAHLVRNVTRADHPVFFVSLEMSRGELIERMLSSVSQIRANVIRKGDQSQISDYQRDLMSDAMASLRRLPIFWDDEPSQTVARIAANARRLKNRHGIKLVVIDYLQLIEPEDNKANRNEQIGRISRRLKFLAKELKVPVVALAQLNRNSETENRRPKLSDLRDSGSIEQDADNVMFLHRVKEEEDQPPPENDRIDLIIEKQRNGPTGHVEMIHRRPFYGWDEATPEV